MVQSGAGSGNSSTDEHTRAEVRHRIAQELGIPPDLEHRIFAFPGVGQFFPVPAVHDPIKGEWHTEFAGTRVKYFGVLYGQPPAGDSPKLALFPPDIQKMLARDPQAFDPAMLMQPTLEIWYAEIYPPDSDLGIVMRWSPETGKLLGIPLRPMATIRHEDLDKVKVAFDFALGDYYLRRPAQRPEGTRRMDREAFRAWYADGWNRYFSENDSPPRDVDLIKMFPYSESTFKRYKQRDPQIEADLKADGLIDTY